MDFSLTQEQEVLRDSVREFAEEVIAPKVEEMEETDETPMDVLSQMGQLGMIGVTIPPELGGTGLGHLARMIMIEEVGRVSCAMAMTLQMLQTAAGAILNGGDEEQRRRYLPDLTRGQKYGALAVTEATGGSDPTALETTAKGDGDSYVINGRKCFTTNCHLADIYVLTAKTGEGPRDISAFVVEKGTPGCRPGRREHKLGLLGCQTGEVILDNCRVPKENLLGAEGRGIGVALGGIGLYGRPGTAACALGILNGCLESAAKFAKERVLYGRPIAELQGIQWLISDIYLDLETSRLLTYRAAWMQDSAIRADAEISAAKFYATEAAVRAAKKTMDVHGGYGCMKQYAAQRYYRDAQLLIPSAGTSEIQRLVMVRKPLS